MRPSGASHCHRSLITNLKYSANSDYDFTAEPLISSDQDNNYSAFSEELRAQTHLDLPINLMMGGYYQHTTLNFAQGAALYGSEDTLAPPGDQFIAYSKLSATSGRTLAGFGQVTWKFLPELEISAGSRYTDETKDSFFGQPFVNPFYAAVYPAGDRVTANQHFYNFSPETTLTWNAGRDLTLYGAYKTGYKSGGSSNSAITSAFGNGAQDLTFKPETVRGIEAGVKAALLDRTLRFNFNAYRYEFSDL